MELPLSVDLTRKGKIVKRASLGEKGYFDNIEYTIQLHPSRTGVHIEYYGEDDTYLDEEQMKQVFFMALGTK